MRTLPPYKGRTYIYALLDPFTMAIRYVGRSKNPKARFQTHLNYHFDSEIKNEWIKRSLLRGRKPILSILDLVPDDQAVYAERLWLTLCELNQCDLTNQQNCEQHRYYQAHKRPTFRSGVQSDCYSVIWNASRGYNWDILNLFLRRFGFLTCLRMWNERYRG